MMVSIESILNHVKYPEKVLKSSYNKSGRYPIIDQSSQFIAGYTDDPEPLFKVDKPVICFGDHTRVVKYVDFSFVLGADGVKILSPNETVDTKYLYYLLECLEITNLGYSRHYKVLKEIRIPLPPLDVQREIVAEVEGYQRVIDGARQVVESWQPRIAVDPAWPVVKLGDYSELIRGVTYRKSDEVNAGGVKVLRANNIVVGENRLDLSDIKLVSETVGFSSTKKLRRNDIFICLASGSKDHIGKVAFIPSDTEYYFGGFMGAVRVASPNLSAKYLFYQLGDKLFNDYLQNQIAGANINNLSASILMDYQIPLPPLPEQQRIIAEIERERAAVDANRELITLMEARIRAVIDRVWGE